MYAYNGLVITALLFLATAVQGGVLQPEEDLQLPPSPYSFSYSAGRRPGHTDRVHSEARDANGVVHGEFSYVDPRNRVRTVQYVADAAGFHPSLNWGQAPVTDTPAVEAAKLRHLQLKERIAAEHARIGAERAALAPPPEQVLIEPARITRTNPEHEVSQPQPYSFGYTAGRFPGHVDRVHSETGDENGVKYGEFSYLDPRNRLRTVQYVADAAGFHPSLNWGQAPVTDTPAVEAAKLRHFQLKEKIAAQHARIAAERPPEILQEESSAIVYSGGHGRSTYPVAIKN